MIDVRKEAFMIDAHVYFKGQAGLSEMIEELCIRVRNETLEKVDKYLRKAGTSPRTKLMTTMLADEILRLRSPEPKGVQKV